MEWKLERTAPRRVRTEEEMLWVSNVLLFPSPDSLKGTLPAEDQQVGQTLNPDPSFILRCVIQLCSRGAWLVKKMSKWGWTS